MSTKEILYREIENATPQALKEVLEHLQLLNKKATGSNSDKVIQHIGMMNNDDAAELKTIIGQEFEKIEGEWK